MSMDEVLDIKGTEFNRTELKRIIDLIPQTDPRSRDYAQLLECIERYIYFANVIAAAQAFIENGVQPKPQMPTDIPESNIIPFNAPVAEPEKFDEPEAEDTTEYDPAVVKSLLSRARADKKIPSVKDWINSNFGVDGFAAIPAKRYPEVMAKLKELGVS